MPQLACANPRHPRRLAQGKPCVLRVAGPEPHPTICRSVASAQDSWWSMVIAHSPKSHAIPPSSPFQRSGSGDSFRGESQDQCKSTVHTNLSGDSPCRRYWKALLNQVNFKTPETNHPGTSHVHGRPLCTDKKKEKSKGQRETGPLTRPILDPLKVQGKDFAAGDKDSNLRILFPH